MNEGSLFLFCSYESTECFGLLEIMFLVSLESSVRGGVHGLGSIWGARDRVLGVFGKLWTRRGAWAWFHLGCLRLCSWCLWKALDEEGCMGFVPFGMLEIVFLVSLESHQHTMKDGWKVIRKEFSVGFHFPS